MGGEEDITCREVCFCLEIQRKNGYDVGNHQ